MSITHGSNIELTSCWGWGQGSPKKHKQHDINYGTDILIHLDPSDGAFLARSGELIRILIKHLPFMHPLYLFRVEHLHFEREVKYLAFLDSTMTRKNHVSLVIREFHIDSNDIAHLFYSNQMNLWNRLLLYKTLLCPIFFYAFSAWGPTVNSTMQKIQNVKKNTPHNISQRSVWYIGNSTDQHDSGIVPIRQSIKDTTNLIKFANLSENEGNPTFFF